MVAGDVVTGIGEGPLQECLRNLSFCDAEKRCWWRTFPEAGGWRPIWILNRLRRILFDEERRGSLMEESASRRPATKTAALVDPKPNLQSSCK